MDPGKYKKKTQDFGAGLRISKATNAPTEHPAGPPKHGQLSQAERAFTLASTFMSGVVAIVTTQFMGAPLKLIDPTFYDAYMAYTKECFAVLITCLTQWWAPTVVRVSGDSSMLGQLKRGKDGNLKCEFESRMILMANHQLYTDWLYLWWIAYTNNMHGFVYIILKESIKNIPIIGWGCQFYNFIFLSRKWEQDQSTFKRHLTKLNKPKDPMWLIIFPEGTNLSATTREKSAAWAKKQGLQDMKHQLLPRSTGLGFCLNELKDTTEWLYDCTIAYEGVPEGQFGQDIFTLRSSFMEGRPPKSVNMHWRRFHIDSIPYKNTHAFEVWLRNRWREKDYMLEYFQRHNRFPADDFWKEHLDMDAKSSASSSKGGKSIRTMPKPAITIETEVKSGSWNEFVKIFAPITAVASALTMAYGASPGDLPFPGGKEMMEKYVAAMVSGGELKGLPSAVELEQMIVGAGKKAIQREGGSEKIEEQGQVHQLTQENLAKLVKETAIKNGMVLPGGMRKVDTALPAMTAPPMKAQSVVGTKPAPKLTAKKAKNAANLPTTPKRSVAPAKKPVKPRPLSKPKPEGEMQAVTTASGVTIKIPKAQVEEAKKTGTIVTKDGVVIRIGKEEVEEAEKKKGSSFVTAGGIPIKITPGGAMAIDQKDLPQPKAKIVPVNNAPKPKTQAKANAPVVKKPVPKATPAAKAPIKRPTGPQVVTKKSLEANGIIRPAGASSRPQAPKPAVKKT